MAVALTCPECGKSYANIPPKFYGKRIRCRQCEAVLDIPNPSSLNAQQELPPVRRKKRKQAAQRSNTTAPTTKLSTPAKKKKLKSDTGQTKGWSLWKVYAALFVFICAAGWTEMAAEYARHTEEWRPLTKEESKTAAPLTRRGRGMQAMGMMAKSLGNYLWNGVTKIGSFPQVLHHSFTQRLWLPITILVVQIVCFFCVAGVSSLEKKHAAEERRQMRKLLK